MVYPSISLNIGIKLLYKSNDIALLWKTNNVAIYNNEAKLNRPASESIEHYCNQYFLSNEHSATTNNNNINTFKRDQINTWCDAYNSGLITITLSKQANQLLKTNYYNDNIISTIQGVFLGTITANNLNHIQNTLLTYLTTHGHNSDHCKVEIIDQVSSLTYNKLTLLSIQLPGLIPSISKLTLLSLLYTKHNIQCVTSSNTNKNEFLSINSYYNKDHNSDPLSDTTTTSTTTTSNSINIHSLLPYTYTVNLPTKYTKLLVRESLFFQRSLDQVKSPHNSDPLHTMDTTHTNTTNTGHNSDGSSSSKYMLVNYSGLSLMYLNSGLKPRPSSLCMIETGTHYLHEAMVRKSKSHNSDSYSSSIISSEGVSIVDLGCSSGALLLPILAEVSKLQIKGHSYDRCGLPLYGYGVDIDSTSLSLAYNNTIANSHVFNGHQLHVKGHNYDPRENTTNTNNKSYTTTINLSTYTNNTSSNNNNNNNNNSNTYNNINISYYNSDFTKIDQFFGHTNNNKVCYKYRYITILYYNILYSVYGM